MIAAFDTYYFGNQAQTVCLLLHSWEDETYQATAEVLENVAAYQPGEFYKRELPCIVSLFKQVQHHPIDAIIIDGYVFLDDAGKHGLGGHLYQALDAAIPVIGVAKSNYALIEHNKRALLRGGSNRPLYITAIGMDLDTATAYIKNMSGPYRIPTLLKTLDTLTRATMLPGAEPHQ